LSVVETAGKKGGGELFFYRQRKTLPHSLLRKRMLTSGIKKKQKGEGSPYWPSLTKKKGEWKVSAFFQNYHARERGGKGGENGKGAGSLLRGK